LLMVNDSRSIFIKNPSPSPINRLLSTSIISNIADFVRFSDHSIIIICSRDLKKKQGITAHNNSVFALQYAPDYQYLLSGSRDAHLKVWDSGNGYKLKESIIAHMYAINDIAFREGGKYFATCSMDKSIKIWDSKSFKLLKVIDKGRHAGHGTSVNKLKWISYNDQLLSASDDRTISIWEIYNLP